MLWIKLVAGNRAYWAGYQLPPRPSDDVPGRAAEWSLVILAVLLVSAFVFARYLARPLRELNDAVASVGKGRSPPPLPETGPSEIVTVNRGFNQMLSNLRQMEQDRAVLLAGVSHDLRTPLARLRLGIEVGGQDERARQGMVEDIEEMDRIIGQFLDFARDDGVTTAWWKEERGERVFVDHVDWLEAQLPQPPVGDVADVLLDLLRSHSGHRALLEGGPRVLPAYPEDLSRSSASENS